MPSFKVTALRHTAPEISSGICYGVLDLPVDADEVLRTARQWVQSGAASALPYQGVLLTSPLQRCALLAQAIKDLRPDVQLVQDPRLMEMNFGYFEGVAWDDVPQASWDAWLADFAHHPFGGAESVAQFMQRVQQAIRPWVPHGQVTCVTHAGVMKALTLWAQGVHQPSDAAQWPKVSVAYGQALDIELTQGI